MERSKKYRSRKKNEGNIDEALIKEQAILRKRVQNLIKKQKVVEVQKLVTYEDGNKSWGRDAQAKVCDILCLYSLSFLVSKT